MRQLTLPILWGIVAFPNKTGLAEACQAPKAYANIGFTSCTNHNPHNGHGIYWQGDVSDTVRSDRPVLCLGASPCLFFYLASYNGHRQQRKVYASSGSNTVGKRLLSAFLFLSPQNKTGFFMLNLIFSLSASSCPCGGKFSLYKLIGKLARAGERQVIYEILSWATDIQQKVSWYVRNNTLVLKGVRV